jgi:hypothetical protein
MSTGDFVVADLLADCKISQSEEFDVGVISVVALHVFLLATYPFGEHPGKGEHVQKGSIADCNVGSCYKS